MPYPPPSPIGSSLRRGDLRAGMRARRRAIGAEAAASAAARLAARLPVLVGELTTGPVAAYVATDGEIDPHDAVVALLDQGVECTLPRVEASGLSFRSVSDLEGLVEGAYGIPAPPAGAPERPVGDHGALIVPVVAFDDQGTRLGMGAGYYDRALVDRRGPVIGVAHDRQRWPRLDRRAWDVPLDLVVTPTMVLRPH